MAAVNEDKIQDPINVVTPSRRKIQEVKEFLMVAHMWVIEISVILYQQKASSLVRQADGRDNEAMTINKGPQETGSGSENLIRFTFHLQKLSPPPPANQKDLTNFNKTQTLG